MKITKYEDVPVSELSIGLSQARVRDVNKNIDDLAESIRRLGLLEPIVVAKNSNGNYEVVTGQRRFLAVSKLGWETVRAGILDQMPTENMAKAISLTENMVREDMSEKDYVDACTELYRHYGSIKAVSEELGLPYSKVQKYVKFDQLVEPLKDKVNSGEMKLDTALRAQKAATSGGEINQEKAIALASEMANMAGVQQRQLEKVARRDPNASLEEILEVGRKQTKVKNLTVVISDSIDDALSTYAQEEGSNRDDAAVSLIFEGLLQKGYMSEE